MVQVFESRVFVESRVTVVEIKVIEETRVKSLPVVIESVGSKGVK